MAGGKAEFSRASLLRSDSSSFAQDIYLDTGVVFLRFSAQDMYPDRRVVFISGFPGTTSCRCSNLFWDIFPHFPPTFTQTWMLFFSGFSGGS